MTFISQDLPQELAAARAQQPGFSKACALGRPLSALGAFLHEGAAVATGSSSSSRTINNDKSDDNNNGNSNRRC